MLKRVVAVGAVLAASIAAAPLLAQDAKHDPIQRSEESTAPGKDDEEPEFDPATVTVDDILGCKLPVPHWNGFAFWFHDNPKAHRQLGMKKLASKNPFLSEYALVAPIKVFGRTTDRVVFTNSGMMAVLSDASPQVLAGELGITPTIDAPGKYLGERVILDRPFDGGVPEMQGRERVTRDLSTVTTHPGKVLVGCSYRFVFPD